MCSDYIYNMSEQKSLIAPVNVVDGRLDVSDQLPFGVYKGAQEMTVSKFPANSEAPTSHTYNIQVPSRSTIIDRRAI